jgi:DNA-binding HxlR family transcriptional regulator
MGEAERRARVTAVQLVEDVLGCKWTLQVLGAIAAGVRRPGRIRRAVAGISTKVMNERLQKLVGHGVLERRALSLMPPHVEYELTAKGRELAALVGEVQRFCARWDAPGAAVVRTGPAMRRRPGAASAPPRPVGRGAGGPAARPA